MGEASAKDAKTKLEVMTHFDKEASVFDFERTAAGYRLRHRLVKNLITRERSPGALALDMGCGTGEYTLLLAREGFEVVGGDLSKEMLAVAKTKIKVHRLAQKIQLIRLESTRLPFRNESFHIVTCIAVIEWVPDSYRLLVEASRVLKHQARFIGCVGALWSPSRVCRNIHSTIIRRGKKRARIPNALKLKRTLTACSFIIEKFFGDIMLAQVITHLLYEPEGKVLADRILKVTQPLDRHLTNLPILKSLSDHYIIEARKK